MNTLVTGGNGLIGRALISCLARNDFQVRTAVRKHGNFDVAGFTQNIAEYNIGDIGPATDWTDALDGVQTVVHLAARVHVMKDGARNPLAEFRSVNTLGTTQLAIMAAQRGVKRFVYLSTIKVNGEFTADCPFHETDVPRPADPYAVSKWEAEQALRRISEEYGMEVIIVRPPLVYGPGVGGNILSMLKWVERGIPLPLASVSNRRSLVGLNNLVSLLMICLSHPRAPGEVFFASDGEDISTPELLQRTAQALGKPVRLFPFPERMLRMSSRFLDSGKVCGRLCDSLTVDSSKAQDVLGWSQVSTMDEELQRMADWYLSRRNH